MATIIEFNGFKVVNQSSKSLRNGRGTVNFTRSALLNASPLTTDYAIPNGNGQQFYHTAPRPTLPIIAFDDAQAAFDFAAGKPGRAVYRLHAYATKVLPVKKVLKLNLGWDRQADEFWKAVQDGADLKDFETRSAPLNSVAIWGPVRLTERLWDVPQVPVVPEVVDGDQAKLGEAALPASDD